MVKKLLIVFLLLVSVALTGCASTSQSTSDFNKAAQEKFVTVKNAFDSDVPGQLDKIECFQGNCTVVYFYFNQLPDDYKNVISMNAATLSNLLIEKTGTSNVNVSAKFNGQTVYSCDASKGKIAQCK